jgi:DMSO/TMAO reductase YedYZ molybdopterin-dependent catalytic subunit
MTFAWPRRNPGLPPGQRLLTYMPRFADNPFAPPPDPLPDLALRVTHQGAPVAEFDDAAFQALGPRDIVADFHCVTTWSVAGLTWTGVPLREVLASVGITAAPAPFVVAQAADRHHGHFLAEDALADDVLLATHLDGEPLGARHGGLLRLVAPNQYGYKSIKHLISLDFRSGGPHKLGKEHLRARVNHEERHPTLPNWLVKMPYRLAIPPTAYFAERSLPDPDRHGP